VETFIIDELVKVGVVRFKQIDEIFGDRFSAFGQTFTESKYNARLCQKFLIPFMEQKYVDIVYVLEDEVATFHRNCHSWVNGYFKYTGPHSLFVAGNKMYIHVNTLFFFIAESHLAIDESTNEDEDYDVDNLIQAAVEGVEEEDSAAELPPKTPLLWIGTDAEVKSLKEIAAKTKETLYVSRNDERLGLSEDHEDYSLENEG